MSGQQHRFSYHWNRKNVERTLFFFPSVCLLICSSINICTGYEYYRGETPLPLLYCYPDAKCLFCCLFSSPEHEVLMVSHSDQSLSVACALLTFCFKWLLQNGWTDFKKKIQESSLVDPLQKLLKLFRSVEQDGHQS